MTRLVDLSPQFIRYEWRTETWDVIDGPEETWRERGCLTKQKTGEREYYVTVSDLASAQGIMFKCPACVNKSGHLVGVTFRDRGVDDRLGSHNSKGEPSRWGVSGDSMENLSLYPSVDCGCWHGHVTEGRIA